MSIKWSYPPFDADSTSQSTVNFSLSTIFLSGEYIVTLSGVKCTVSPFSNMHTSLVYFKSAGISDAIKFSFFPSPTIRGLSFLTATISFGFLEQITPKAYAPLIIVVSLFTASSRFPSYILSKRCTITSVSV